MTTMTLAEPIDSLTWRRSALCNPDTADLFTPGPYRGKDLPPSVAYAISICRRCPVIDWCAAEHADRTDLSGQIVAGIYHE